MKIHIHQAQAGYWQVVYMENGQTKFEFIVETKEQAHEFAIELARSFGRLPY